MNMHMNNKKDVGKESVNNLDLLILYYVISNIKRSLHSPYVQ